MPNYVINRVVINGSAETISKVKKQILNYDDGEGNYVRQYGNFCQFPC